MKFIIKKFYSLLSGLILTSLISLPVLAAQNNENSLVDESGITILNRSTEGVSISDVNSYTAYDIGEGYSITDMYSESSPDVTGEIIRENIYAKPITYTLLMGAITTATANSTNGYVGQNIFMNGNHSVQISNFTNITQSYRVEYTLQANNGRFFKAYTVHVQPGISFNESARSGLNNNFPIAGKYSVCAHTRVAGESNILAQGCGTVAVIQR